MIEIDITGRETTAKLLAMLAAPVAKGAAPDDVHRAALMIVRDLLPFIGEADEKRAAQMLAWAMHLQHTQTLKEVELRRKLSKIFE